MNCHEARDLLLEADRSDLLGDEATELGRHVAACAECSAMARQFLDAEVALDGALAKMKPATRRRSRVAPWVGLAAAATLVMILLPRQHPPATQSESIPPRVSPAVDVDVSSSAGRTAVVLRTADPGITVVWYFQD